MIAVVALSLRLADRGPARALPPDGPLLPAEVFKGLEALLGTPPEARDDAWRERARTWLMRPIPTRVPCRWLALPQVVWFVGDQVVALDQQGRVRSCGITTGTVSEVASDVTCVRQVDDTMFGVAFRDRRIAVYQHRISGWSLVTPDGPTEVASTGAGRDVYCPFHLRSRGILPPKISLPGELALPQQDLDVLADGGRQIVLKADRSLWVQAGDAPVLLVPSPVR